MTFTAEERAQVLAEALPYIQRFHGETLVVKLGGSALENAEATLIDLALLRYVGMRPVLVHGGGPDITDWQRRMGIEPKFVDGLRVTDEKTMELVKMVLTGKVNPELVAILNRHGVQAVGMSGEDGATVIAEAESEALGLVGRVRQVNAQPVADLLDRGYVPVIASIALGYDGNSYNVNADTFAAELAVALGAARLILLTDVSGVKDAGGQLISEMRPGQVEQLISAGVAEGGMIPKLQACARALQVTSGAHIIDGRVRHALLLELLTESGIGTMMLPERVPAGAAG